jgi:hypothetical protein
MLDLPFLVNNNFEHITGTGAELAAKLIVDKCVVELDNLPDWTVQEVICTLEFIKKDFEKGGNMITTTAICSIISKMGESLSLFFDENLTAMLGFYLDILPHIRNLELEADPDLLQDLFDRLRERENEGD